MSKKKEVAAKVEDNTSTEALNEALENNELVAEAAIDILTDEVPAEDEVTEEAPTEEVVEEKTEDETKEEEVKAAEAPKEEPKEDPKPSKEDVVATADVLVVNTSFNPICLQGNEKGQSVTLAPKEIKRVPRALYRVLMQQKAVRAWFDKGVLTSKADADEVEASDAVAPAELTAPVTRNASTAEVKKFEKDGTFKLEI